MKYNIASVVGVAVWTIAWLKHSDLKIGGDGENLLLQLGDPSYFLWVVGAIAFAMLACYFTALWYGE